MLFSILALLAEADDKASPGNPLGIFLPMIIIFVLFWFLMIRPQQKRQQMERLQLLAGMKKNDKVLTSGGLIGIIALINDKEEEVTLKVDESSNVRIRVLKSSIIKNYTAEEAAKDQAAKDKAAKEEKSGKGTDEAITAAKK
jgi:preprotein translocase subunit YajC